MLDACTLLFLAGLAAAPATSEVRDGARSLKIDALFEAYTEGVQPGAAAMVILDGRIVHARGYGYANLATREPFTPATSTRLGSVAKQFVAMGILVLERRGQLSVDDPVVKYVPELQQRYGGDITLAHLLSHTSGLPDYYDALDQFESEMPRNAEGAAVFARWGTPEFQPGERFEYSNPGYEMLGLVLERVSGLSFGEFLQQAIFAPLGMQGTLAYERDDIVVPNRAYGYRKLEDGGFVTDDLHRLNWMMGAGGLYSSLVDLFRWDQSLYGEALASREQLARAFSPTALKDGSTSPYGFGWGVGDFHGHRRLAHGGGWVGFRTRIERFPDDGLTIVLLSNRGDFDPDDYLPPIAELYLGVAEE